MAERFSYGGQAVIEGVMIRGRRFFSLAVRRPNGTIHTECESLNPLFIGRLRRIPVLRGVLMLVEMLALGMKVLNRSAMLALEEELQDEKPVPKWAMGLTMGIALLVGVALFFVLPLFLVRLADSRISSSVVSNLVEGLIRLAVFVVYIWAVSYMKEIRRVFAYHGAEHRAVHAYEAGLPLEVASLKRYSTAHPRCGTAFLLVVMAVAILVFAFLGRPSIEWRIASRILFIPVIAGVSYEIIRFSGRHAANPLVRFVLAPNLWLQRLTTRQPDDAQMEVAIAAMQTALAADEGTVPVAPQPAADPLQQSEDSRPQT